LEGTFDDRPDLLEMAERLKGRRAHTRLVVFQCRRRQRTHHHRHGVGRLRALARQRRWSQQFLAAGAEFALAELREQLHGAQSDLGLGVAKGAVGEQLRPLVPTEPLYRRRANHWLGVHQRVRVELRRGAKFAELLRRQLTHLDVSVA